MKAKRDANGSGRERKMNNDIDGKRRQLVQRLKIWGYKDTKKYDKQIVGCNKRIKK